MRSLAVVLLTWPLLLASAPFISSLSFRAPPALPERPLPLAGTPPGCDFNIVHTSMGSHWCGANFERQLCWRDYAECVLRDPNHTFCFHYPDAVQYEQQHNIATTWKQREELVMPNSRFILLNDSATMPVKSTTEECRNVPRGELFWRSVRNLIGADAMGGKRYIVFIRRVFAKKRDIENWSEVLEALQRLGPVRMYYGNESFVQTIALFYNSIAIVGMHGAGLKNTLFSPHGCVVEFTLSTPSNKEWRNLGWFYSKNATWLTSRIPADQIAFPAGVRAGNEEIVKDYLQRKIKHIHIPAANILEMVTFVMTRCLRNRAAS